MEINRKTYSWIIKLLRGKELSADDALEIADNICELLEKAEVNTIIPTWPINREHLSSCAAKCWAILFVIVPDNPAPR